MKNKILFMITAIVLALGSSSAFADIIYQIPFDSTLDNSTHTFSAPSSKYSWIAPSGVSSTHVNALYGTSLITPTTNYGGESITGSELNTTQGITFYLAFKPQLDHINTQKAGLRNSQLRIGYNFHNSQLSQRGIEMYYYKYVGTSSCWSSNFFQYTLNQGTEYQVIFQMKNNKDYVYVYDINNNLLYSSVKNSAQDLGTCTNSYTDLRPLPFSFQTSGTSVPSGEYDEFLMYNDIVNLTTIKNDIDLYYNPPTPPTPPSETVEEGFFGDTVQILNFIIDNVLLSPLTFYILLLQVFLVTGLIIVRFMTRG